MLFYVALSPAERLFPFPTSYTCGNDNSAHLTRHLLKPNWPQEKQRQVLTGTLTLTLTTLLKPKDPCRITTRQAAIPGPHCRVTHWQQSVSPAAEGTPWVMMSPCDEQKTWSCAVERYCGEACRLELRFQDTVGPYEEGCRCEITGKNVQPHHFPNHSSSSVTASHT